MSEKPLGTLGDLIRTEPKENPVEEIKNLRALLGINCSDFIPNDLTERNELLEELRLRVASIQFSKLQNLDQKIELKRQERIDNSTAVFDHPHSPKRTEGEACESHGCSGVVFGNAKYCDSCRKKKQQEKRQSMGIHRHHYPDSFWKNAILAIEKIQKGFDLRLPEAIDAYSSLFNVKLSPSGYYRKKKELNPTESDSNFSLTPEISDKIQRFLGSPNNVSESVVRPHVEESRPCCSTAVSQVEQQILDLFRHAVTDVQINKILNWLSALPDEDQSFQVLQTVLDCCNLRFQEITEIRRKKNEEVKAAEERAKKIADLKAQLSALEK